MVQPLADLAADLAIGPVVAPAKGELIAQDDLFEKQTIGQLWDHFRCGTVPSHRSEAAFEKLKKRNATLEESIAKYHAEGKKLRRNRLSFTPRPDATDSGIADWLEELAMTVFEGPLHDDAMQVVQALRDRGRAS